MPSLAELQNQFQSYIHQTNTDNSGDSTQSANNSIIPVPPITPIHQAIVNDAIVGTKKRLSIYYNAYRYRLIETLATQFPKLYLYLGDKQFKQHALAYIEQNPSTCRNLRNYGSTFNDFLAQEIADQPQIAELAKFEWLLGLAFDALNHRLITVEDLANIAPEEWGGLHFSFHDSVKPFITDWNTVEIWQALNSETTPPPAVKLVTPIHWVIWRAELDANYRSLSAQETLAFTLAYGEDGGAADFATICEALADNLENIQKSGDSSDANIEDIPMIAAQYLVQWLNDEYIVAIHQT